MSNIEKLTLKNNKQYYGRIINQTDEWIRFEHQRLMPETDYSTSMYDAYPDPDKRILSYVVEKFYKKDIKELFENDQHTN